MDTDPQILELSPARLLLTKAQAAEALTISVRKVTDLVAAGDITPTRIGRSVRFAPSELEAFIRRQTRAPEPEPAARYATYGRRRR